MPDIQLPDGSHRQFPEPLTGLELARTIGSGLAKAAVAMRVDGTLKDLSTVLDENVAVAIITKDSPEGLEVIRHSTAHLMAQAVQSLFPGVQVTIGPVIENGFYYDFASARSFTVEDLAAIEKRMRELVKQNLAVQREVLSRDAAIDLFESMGEDYKVQIIRDIPASEALSLYRQG
ncbi:MAG: TGS domain-containing protein, partial [Acidithiobacillus sp.]|nr:TGS domain-containing protein [Acidithiobacillus sp.]